MELFFNTHLYLQYKQVLKKYCNSFETDKALRLNLLISMDI